MVEDAKWNFEKSTWTTIKPSGHIGYSIAKERRGKGYGTVGLRLTIQIAKEIIPKEEIYLRVNKDNISSQKVMKKNGAYPVGEDEEHIFMRIAK